MQPVAILLVEDDTLLQQLLKELLDSFSSQVVIAECCQHAYAQLAKQQFDLVILDRSLPDGDSLEIAQYLTDMEVSTRILFLSALKTNIEHKMQGYQAGCTDYVCKPICGAEFKMKVKALLSVRKIANSSTLQFADIALFPASGQLRLQNKTTKILRRKETEILACLLRHRPSVVTKEQLIQQVWGLSDCTPAYSTLDVYIRRLRIHLEHKHQVIKTARGFGYYVSE